MKGKNIENFVKSFMAFAIVSTMASGLLVTAHAEEATLISVARGGDVPFNETNISSFNLTGGAKVLNGKVELVPANGNSVGGLFLKERLKSTEGFSAAFTAHFGSGSSRPADGLVFVVAKDSNSIGARGEGIAYSGIKNSIGIEYDTYNNDSVETPHIALDKNGVVDSDTDATGVTNLPWTVDKNYILYSWVDYDSTKKELHTRFARENDRSKATLVTYNIDLGAELGTEYYMGFTSATGGEYQKVDIGDFYIDNKYHENGLIIGAKYVDDVTAPTKPTKIEIVDGKFVVTGGTDESGAVSYQYSYDQKTWSNVTGLAVDETKEKLYFRTVDGSGNLSEIVEYIIPKTKDTTTTITPKKRTVPTDDRAEITSLIGMLGLSMIGLFVSRRKEN